MYSNQITDRKTIGIDGYKAFNSFLYIFYMVVYEILIVKYAMGNKIGNYRYYTLFLVTLISLLLLLIMRKKGNKRQIFGKELLYMIIPAILFYIVSYYKASSLNSKVIFRTYTQISLFLLPALYAFNVVNCLSMKKIIGLLKFTTILTIIMYFTEPLHTIDKFFELQNWLNINFVKSDSFTESHNFFDTFIQLFFFFNYYKDKVSDKKQKQSLNFFSILTFIFTFMSFKRFGLVFIIVTLILNKYLKNNKRFDKKITLLLSIVFLIITVFYTKVLQGEIFNYTYETLSTFTSGRKWFLDIWKSYDYISYGYGSSMYIIGRFLEMDLIEIYLELNVFCLFAFIYSLFKIAKQNKYAIFIMIYVLGNMLSSSSLPWTSGFIIMFITVASISSNKFEIETKGVDKNE